jgi:hypothetical protein
MLNDENVAKSQNFVILSEAKVFRVAKSLVFRYEGCIPQKNESLRLIVPQNDRKGKSRSE